ncbi:LytTR family DNA-binding domain-containing protein [Marinilabilia sp.]|uniref:LytR/AlgR family response regulator transcription factor n=1 Tax=Marinilabilia sp. TaxID=2021252 RepID=UPI0025C36F3D|nr:LytTR family DNA-binding domain-containing protein [Marinilabilia sp.]
MNVLIIEDEPLAAEKLVAMLKKYDAGISVLSVCTSVTSAVKWLNTNPSPDLGLFDIQLGDGTSFDIFDSMQIHFPVIFTTAFDHFAIRAFKVNSVDYLLKPIENEDLAAAIQKFKNVHIPRTDSADVHQAVASMVRAMKSEKKFRERFVISVGQHLKVINASDIVCFFSEEKNTFILNAEGRSIYLDQSLNQLEEDLDPNLFFRTSRREILNFGYISDIISYGRSRLKVKINLPGDSREIVVSKERVKAFRAWLENFKGN